MNQRNSKRLRLAVYVQAALQIMVPLQASWANTSLTPPRQATIKIEALSAESARKEAEKITREYFNIGYTLKKGDTLKEVAKSSRIDLLTLREINRVHIPNDSAFYALKSGDYVLVPDWNKSRNGKDKPVNPFSGQRAKLADSSLQNKEKDNNQEITSRLSTLGGVLQSKDQSSAARSLAVGSATNAAAQSVQEWINQFGNSRIGLNVDEHLHYHGASGDVLIPLGDKESKKLAFTQAGITDKDHYTTLNVGIGQRHFNDTYMLGYNIFLDQELRNQHTRIGVGSEYWRDFIKLAGNFYTGLSGWKESKQLEDYEERPATGFDLRAEAWLPSMPQLGGKLMLEQYFGNQVALISTNDRQKDPTAVTVGLNYTPVPLITTGVDQRFSKGVNDTQLNLQFNYQFGVPFSQQLDPESVRQRRTLAGSRLDFVDRNNAMVMDYRKMEVITLYLPPLITGKVSQGQSITATVKARHGLKKVEWDTSAILAAGGRVTANKDNLLSLTLPAKSGSYPLTATAWDKKGNVSNTASMTVDVLPDVTQPEHKITQMKAQPLQQEANGTDVITYSLRAVKPDGNALKNTRVQWSGDRGVIQQVETRTNEAGESSTTIVSSETGKVNLKAVLLDEAGNKLTEGLHKDAEFVVTQSSLTLKADKVSAIANGRDLITFTFNAKDSANNPLANRTITWVNVDNIGNLTPVSQKTDDNGNARATLMSTTQGNTRITATLMNADGSAGQSVESQTVSFNRNLITTLSEDKINAIADGTDKVTLTYDAKDENGSPLARQKIQWSSSPDLGTLTPIALETDENGKAAATLSSLTDGTTKIAVTLLDKEDKPISRSESHNLSFAHATKLTLEANSTAAIANGLDTITLTYKAVDNNDTPLANRQIEWKKTSVGELTPIDSKTNDQGEAKATLTSKVIGKTIPEVILKNADGSSHATTSAPEIEFQQGTIATLTANPSNALADGYETITFSYHAEDELEQPIVGEEIEWSVVSGGIGKLVPMGTKTDTQGNAKATLTSTVAGNSQIQVVMKKTGSAKTSPQVNFNTSTILTLSANPPSAKADDKEEITFTYKALNATNQPLADRPIAWDNVKKLGTLKSFDQTTNKNGEAKAVLVSKVEGKTQLAVVLKNADGNEIARTQSGDVEFVMGVIHSVTPNKTTALADGYDEVLFEYQALNSQRAPIANAEIEWENTNSVGELHDVMLTTNNDGIATAKLSSNRVGDAIISVRLVNKDLITNSLKVTFDKSANLVLEPNKKKALNDGKETIVYTFTAKDRLGNVLKDRPVTWDSSGVGIIQSSDSRTNGNGEAQATLTSTQIGKTSLDATLGNADGSAYSTISGPEVKFLQDSQFNLGVAPTHALADGVEKITFTFYAQDEYGEPMEGADIDWSLLSNSVGSFESTMNKTNDKGEATASLISNVVGDAQVKVIMGNGEATLTSDAVNFDREIIQTLNYDKSLAAPNGTDPIIFTYTATNNNGGALAGRSVSWEDLNKLGEITSFEPTTNANGTAKATLVSKNLGSTAMKVTLMNAEGNAIADKVSDTVTFMDTGLGLKVDLDKNIAEADGYDTVTVTFTALSGKEPIADEPISWELDGSIGTIEGPNKTDENGIAKATIVSNKVGATKVIVVMEKAGYRLPSETILFGKTVKAELKPEPDSAQANGRDAITFTFTAKDGNGSPLKNREVEWSNNTSTGDWGIKGDRTNDNGEVTAKLTSTVTGETTVKAVLKTANGSEYWSETSKAVNFTQSTEKTINLATDYGQVLPTVQN